MAAFHWRRACFRVLTNCAAGSLLRPTGNRACRLEANTKAKVPCCCEEKGLLISWRPHGNNFDYRLMQKCVQFCCSSFSNVCSHDSKLNMFRKQNKYAFWALRNEPFFTLDKTNNYIQSFKEIINMDSNCHIVSKNIFLLFLHHFNFFF